MIHIQDILKQTTTLWILFLLTIGMTAAFGLIMYIWDFGVIDEMYHADEILAHIGAMTPTQRSVHSWMTATLDVAYPFAYGGLFVGVALRFFGRFGPWLALPSLAVIPVDLTEGVIQVLLLNGYEHVVGLKEIVTPLKLALYLPGLALTLIALAIGVFRKLRSLIDNPQTQ